MFRGNPTRTFYGTGPLPKDSGVLWKTAGRFCGRSSVGGETKEWCGSGWTGQPVVWERPDGVTEVIFGAYDKAVHFYDAATGEETRPPFKTGDIIKGSVTLDPDGYPLLYFGSRDNKLRILALDRKKPTELWSLDANVVNGVWNNDWDGNPVIVDDVLYEGGENGWFFAIALNRAYEDERVTVDPEIVFKMPGYDRALLDRVGRNVSIESSVAVFEDRVYFANSGGRVLGVDVGSVRDGEAPVVFDYWVGDDVDASVVVDGEGMLYVASEFERRTKQSKKLGQLVKLDPGKPDDPVVWGVDARDGDQTAGIWATPALGDGVVYVTTHLGKLLAVDSEKGDVVWEADVGWHAWSSPVVVGKQLLVATCGGKLRAYSLTKPTKPKASWSLQVSPSCIESTPAVWDGRLYVGSRDGRFYAVG